MPQYIPAHLNGRVGNFSQPTPGGDVSFHDIRNTDGLGGSQRTMPLSQYKQTFDPSYRNRHFEESINGQYGGETSAPTNLSAQIQNWIAQKARNGFDWGTSSQGKAVGTVGLLSALAGGGIGAMSAARSGEGGILGRGALYALLAGGAGAAGTALAQRQHNLRESTLKKAASAEDTLARALMSDQQLSPYERAEALRALARLPDQQTEELSTLVRMLGGAAVGVVIVRFLRAKGLMSAAAGGIIGALIGAASGNRTSYNKLGQPSIRR